MIKQAELLEILENRFSTDNKNDVSDMEKSISIGIVTSTDDPLQMGRLQIFCPSWGDNPEKIHELPWTNYASPFGGVINNDRFLRGSDKVGSTGSVAYGMWGIPELGSSVVTACIDHDLRRRIWWAVIFDQQETNTILTGRYKWNSDGSVEGPLTSQGLPLEPLYSNFKKAFNGKTNSPEWKTRAASYQAASVNKDLNQSPTPEENSSLDQQTDDIRDNTNFSWDKNRMGTHGYDQSGFSEMPFKASKAFGFSSPGGHTVLMDDKPYNCRTQITSVHGHSILLDDTNERINIRTANGAGWIELDYSGNIDVYAKKRFSVHAEDDINFFSDKSIRIQGTEGVYIYGGADSGLPKLTSPPAIGEVRIQSTNDMSIIANDLRVLSFENTIFEIGGNKSESVGKNSHTQVENNINIITNSGDFNMTITGNYNQSVTNNLNELTVGTASYYSNNDLNLHSYNGIVNIIGKNGIDITALTGNTMISTPTGNTSIMSLGTVGVTATGEISIISSTGVTIVPPADSLVFDPSVFSIHPILPESEPYEITPIVYGVGSGVQVNQEVVTGLQPIPAGTYPIPTQPIQAGLSGVNPAPWTNRTPEHEPWARVMKCDTSTGGLNDEANRNTSHTDQFVDDGGVGSASIGRIEGMDQIPRGPFWRR